MRVLVLEPGYCPYIAFFDSAEEAVRKIIQGEKNVALPFGNEVGYHVSPYFGILATSKTLSCFQNSESSVNCQ